MCPDILVLVKSSEFKASQIKAKKCLVHAVQIKNSGEIMGAGWWGA